MKESHLYFKYDEKNGIKVPSPFNRIMTPIMTVDQTDEPIPFSIHYTEWEPGAEIDEHLHEDSTEAMFCVSGKGIVRLDGVDHEFVPESMICALPGHTHKITNTGTERLRVLCVFSPPVSGEKLKTRAENAVKEYWENHRE